MEYKKRTTKKNNHTFFIMSLIIIALLIVAFFVKPQSQKMDEFYFVRINSYLTYSEASKMSTEIQSMGGAGYIYFDGKYHVIASYYPNEDDALKVVENLKADYSNTNLFTLEVKRFRKLKKFTSAQNEVISDNISSTLSTINKLYSILLKFDKGEIDLYTLSIHISNIYKDCEDCYNDFVSVFRGYKDANIITACEELDEIKNELKNMKLACSNNDAYKLKYGLVSIVFSYSSFLSCF